MNKRMLLVVSTGLVAILLAVSGCGEDGLIGVINSKQEKPAPKIILPDKITTISNTHSKVKINLPFDIKDMPNDEMKKINGEIAPYIEKSFYKFGSNAHVAVMIESCSFDVASINKDYDIDFNISLDNLKEGAKESMRKNKDLEDLQFNNPETNKIDGQEVVMLKGTYKNNKGKKPKDHCFNMIMFAKNNDTWQITIITQNNDEEAKQLEKNIVDSIKIE